MAGSGFNAVPRVFYSREMEPPFVAFFLDITTFIDATPSRILVFPISPCNSFEWTNGTRENFPFYPILRVFFGGFFAFFVFQNTM